MITRTLTSPRDRAKWPVRGMGSKSAERHTPGMVERMWVRRAVGGWAAMTFCFGAAAVLTDNISDEPDVVRVASEGSGDANTATTGLRPRPAPTTTVAEAPVVTEAAPAEATPTTEATDTTAPETTVPTPETTTTTAPPQPTFSMSREHIVASDHGNYVWTAGTGCTGPGHVDDEYGIVGTVYYADGTPWSSGDRVVTEPGSGDWISNMFLGNPGNYTYGYACTRLDGTVVFEYVRHPLTVTP